MPNTVYKVDGNKTFQTDGLGRVEKVESNLSLTKNDRNTYQGRYIRAVTGTDHVFSDVKTWSVPVSVRGKIKNGDLVTAIQPSPQQMANFGL